MRHHQVVTADYLINWVWPMTKHACNNTKAAIKIILNRKSNVIQTIEGEKKRIEYGSNGTKIFRKWKKQTKIYSLTRNLFDKSILWIATIPLCDKSRLHNVIAAKFVSDMTGIFVNRLYDKSNLNNHYPQMMSWKLMNCRKTIALMAPRWNCEQLQMKQCNFFSLVHQKFII